MFQIPESQSNVADSETLHHHATELNFMTLDDYSYTSADHLQLPVFENVDDTTVTVSQPRLTNYRDDNARLDDDTPARRAIPVSIINWETRDETHFIPSSGLDFLQGQSQVIIQQTVELHELQSNMDSAKRYLVKRPEGDTLYYATEESSNFQRLCHGSGRKFYMSLQDRTQQEAMMFKRRTASFWHYSQHLEVWTSGERIGLVKQEFAFGMLCLTVRDDYNNIHYRIEGPPLPICTCRTSKEAYFKIYSPDGMTQCGNISHFWNQVQVEYTLGLQFPSPNTDTKKKALLLGAAFLLEYTYFETSKNRSCRCLC